MGEIAEQMLDGTMDPETGEYNFEGANGPGFPMTGAEADGYRRATGWGRGERYRPMHEELPLYGFWKMIGTALDKGFVTADEIAAEICSASPRVEDALEKMFQSGLTHRHHGPWKLTKRGRLRMERAI